MFRLVTILLAAVLIWSVYWAVGSTAKTTAISGWMEDRRAEGWVADVTEITTQGFPLQFDTTLTDVSVADPDTGLAWDAPVFNIEALSYQPGQIELIWPDTQRLATPLARFEIASRDMRAALGLRPQSNLAFETLSFTVADLTVQQEGASQPARASAIDLAADRVPETEARYKLVLTADGFAPALDWRTRIDPGGSLPESLEALSAEMTLTFDTPWDLNAIEQARPQPRALDLRLAEARWGRLELLMAGALDIDDAGTPTGEITIKARNWREILRLGVDSGALPAGLSRTIEDGLSIMAQLSGNPQTLDIPLNFRNGRVFLGPVPIGPAPVLRLR